MKTLSTLHKCVTTQFCPVAVEVEVDMLVEPRILQVLVNKPFFYMITDNSSKAVVFYGHVVNPHVSFILEYALKLVKDMLPPNITLDEFLNSLPRNPVEV